MKTIRPQELNALLEQDKPVEILDIRPPEQFEKNHIEGAHSLPAPKVSPETLMFSRALLPTEPLYIISESGALAQLMACHLEHEGLTNLVVVGGGMNKWRNDGLPVSRYSHAFDRLGQSHDPAETLALA